jgi:hypothetical protein
MTTNCRSASAACNRAYDYPVHKSLATRFYCEECAGLPPAVRSTFEQFNKRLKTLGTTVQKLEQKLSAAGAKTGQGD